MSFYSMTLGRHVSAENGKSRIGAALSAFGARIVAAQQARAERMVRPHLARLKEEDLKVLGFTSAEIEAIRKERRLPVIRAV